MSKAEYMKKMKMLYQIIIDKHGNISTKDVTEKCGLPFEYFLRLANCDTEKLYQAAKANIDKF